MNAVIQSMAKHAFLHRALGVMLGVLMAAGAASAETREIQGETLVLNSSMSADTVISTDATLIGRVRISLDSHLDCLSATGGGTALITTSGCSGDAGTLRIDVPPDMPLNITGNGEGDIHIFATHAPVILSMNGSGDVTGSDVGHLILSVHGNADVKLGAVQGGAVLDMTGSGDVRLGSVAGELILKHHGSGDLAVGHIEAPVVSIESTGSGDMLIGAGSVGTLAAHMQGDGDLAVAAPVHDADISAYGGGDVKLGAVTGTMHRNSGDGSDIIIGGPALVNTIIGKVAHSISTGEGHSNSTSSGGAHFFHFLLFAIGAFIVWRLIRRRGTISRATQQSATGQMHPGVAAITEKLRHVEERLGRVEGYVTSREFDLQQKFKNL
jgi:hypothetical protein